MSTKNVKDGKKIILLVAVLLITIVCAVLLFGNKKDNTDNKQENTTVTNEVKEEFVEIINDNTKLNVSNKLKETKKIENVFELTNIQLTTEENTSELLGDLKNISSTVQGDYKVDIIIMDENGKEITTIGGYIGAMQPGETTQFNASCTLDIANAYDFKVIKK